MPDLRVLGACLAGALALFTLLRWLRRPLGWLLAGAYRLVLGGVAIWALDALAHPLGLHVALNPASALAVGLLGIPGLALLLVFGGLA